MTCATERSIARSLGVARSTSKTLAGSQLVASAPRQARATSTTLVSDLAVIPARKRRNLLNRETAHEHVAQLPQFRLGPPTQTTAIAERHGSRLGRNRYRSQIYHACRLHFILHSRSRTPDARRIRLHVGVRSGVDLDEPGEVGR
jgi:hypothetical protein